MLELSRACSRPFLLPKSKPTIVDILDRCKPNVGIVEEIWGTPISISTGGGMALHMANAWLEGMLFYDLCPGWPVD
jgi:hypothetical protein